MKVKKYKILFPLFAVSLLLAGVYEYDYHFSPPEMIRRDGHMIVRMEDCGNTGVTGEPQLPAHRLMILMPPGETLGSAELISGEKKRYPLMLPVMPQQPDRPLSMRGIEKKFYKKDAVYRREEYRVPELHTAVHSFRGAAVVLGHIRPLRYFPKAGSIEAAEKMTLRIRTVPADGTRLPQADELGVLRTLTRNPENADLYGSTSVPEPERMLIITSNAFAAAFDSLRLHYRKYGIRSDLVTTQDIMLSEIPGRDLQERIRNTVREYYHEQGLEYLLIGGDSEIVPHRGLSCTVNSGGTLISDDDIPADLYYAALDGTWDNDRDNRFGEYNDSTGYDEADLLQEIAVGRMPASELSELKNLIRKSIRYQAEPVAEEMDRHVFFGEWLYNDPFSLGSDYLELLIGTRSDNGYTTRGVPLDMPLYKWYDPSDSVSVWDRFTVIDALSEGRAFVHHDGHANTNYLMKFMTSQVQDSDFVAVNGRDHVNPLIYTHGCNCGGFDRPDCIGSRLVNGPLIAAGGVFNSRYGWFNEGTTEGPSIHLHREFMSAVYGLGVHPFGQAHMVSRIATAPWVTAADQHEQNALRWTYYTNNILGDPVMRIYSDRPLPVSAAYDRSLLGQGILRVQVGGASGPPEAARLSVLDAQRQLIGYAECDESGFAEARLDTVPEPEDTLYCYIRGTNILPADTVLTLAGSAAAPVPEDYRLDAWPNPFNPAANIRYHIPRAGETEILLYNIHGRKVRTLWSGYRRAGIYELHLQAGDLPSGMYICRMRSGTALRSRKLLLIK